VLFGQLESLVWLEAQGFGSLLDPTALASLPRQIFLLAAVSLILAGLVALLWRPLHLLCFDPDYAAAIGLPARGLELVLNLMVAAAAVAAFEAVGSILVVAMLIIPASTALLLSNRLPVVLALSALVGVLSASMGLIFAIIWETTPGPAMTLVATAFYLLAMLFSPKKGLLLLRIRKASRQR
jgi:manganese/zinc/iron transport system permease protein